MIDIARVSVELDNNLILRDVSHHIAPGRWCCLVGPNGAGKTTLLRAIAGLQDYAGSIRIRGAELGELSMRHRARRIAFVPQNPTVPPQMTVSEYVLLGRTPHLSLLGHESAGDRRIARDVLEALVLTPLASRRLTDISGGELQRVVLSRALAQQAEILILDEPTSALDLGQQQRALELVDELRLSRGLTVISAMHDLTLAGQYADEIMLISRGKLALAGTPSDVFTEHLVRTHYEAEVSVIRSDHGVAVIPRRSAPLTRDDFPETVDTGSEPDSTSSRAAVQPVPMPLRTTASFR